MKRFLILSLLLSSLSVSGQTSPRTKEAVLAEIEKNNTTLAALRQKTIADKQQNVVGNALPDPTVGFSNTWGNQPNSVTKQNFTIEQELDWGTLSGLRKKTAHSENAMVDLNYRVERQTLLAEADRLLVELTYNNALYEEMSYREMRARDLRQLYEKKFNAGDANQLELNKVRLNHMATVATLRNVKAEREAVRENLQRLNGNLPVAFGATTYEKEQLPALTDMLQRVEAQVPQMELVRAAIEREQRRLQLSKAEGMPSLSIGYAGEVARGDNTNGITLGMRIPLWGNSRRKVTQQRSALTLAEMEKTDVETQLKSTLTRQYNSAYSLCQIAREFRGELMANQDLKILDKALMVGQLSLIDYLNEITFYYDARTQALEADRDSQLALSELWTWFR